MTRAQFVTVRWNNAIAAALTLGFALFVVAAVAADFYDVQGGFIALMLVGAVY